MTLVMKHYRRPLSAISVMGERVRITPGVLIKFSKPLDDKKVNIYAISSGEYDLTFFVDEGDTEKATVALTDIISRSPYSEMSVRRSVGAVSVTGPEMLDNPGLLHKMLNPIAKDKLNILAITASFDSGFMFFDYKDAEKAYKLLNAYIPGQIGVFKHAHELVRKVTHKVIRKISRKK